MVLAALFAATNAIDLRTTTVGHVTSNTNTDTDTDTNTNTDTNANTDSEAATEGKSKTDSSADAEWQDANICITYGADYSSTGCGSSCGSCHSSSSCQTTVSCDEVTYTSATFDVEGISSLDTDDAGSTDDLSVSAQTSYEIFGYGDRATLRSKIVLNIKNNDDWNTD